MGLHKGSGLALMCELLGGALMGGLTTRRETCHDSSSIYNSMASIIIDPHATGSLDAPAADAFLDWVQQSPPAHGHASGPLLPGDVERARRSTRMSTGLPVDHSSWRQISDAARAAGVPRSAPELLAWDESSVTPGHG